jgi:hypothetical protein
LQSLIVVPLVVTMTDNTVDDEPSSKKARLCGPGQQDVDVSPDSLLAAQHNARDRLFVQTACVRVRDMSDTSTA